MNRTVVTTLGFLLVFFGIQLNVIDSYVLTPRMANFVSDKFSDIPPIENNVLNVNQNGTPFVQTGYAANAPNAFPVAAAPVPQVNRVIRPPGWIGWPVMFLGAVFFLNGITIRK